MIILAFRKYIYVGLAVLGLLTTGVATLTTHASHVHPVRTTVTYHSRKTHDYLQYHHGIVTPNTGGQDDAASGIGEPDSDGHYDEYLTGQYDLWSKPARWYHGRCFNRGVMITDKAGSRRLALERVPFKGIHGNGDKFNMEIANRDFVGWINSDGLYNYDGSEGKLPIHYSRKKYNKHRIKKYHYKVIKHTRKRTNGYKHRIIKKETIESHKKIAKRTYKSHKGVRQSKF